MGNILTFMAIPIIAASLCAFPSVGDCQDQGRLVDSLARYEAAYYGKRVVTSLKNHSWGMDDLAIWFSNDGAVHVVEWTSNVKRGSGREEKAIKGVYNTPDFSLVYSEEYSDEALHSRHCRALPEMFPENTGTQEHAVLFGFSSIDGQRFSSICQSELAELSVGAFSFEGIDLNFLDCKVPGKGSYRFGFDESLQLVYFEVSKRAGDAQVKHEEVSELGSENKEELQSIRQIWFPILYRDALPVSAKSHTYTGVAKGKVFDHSASGFLTEVLSWEDHSRNLSPIRVEFENVDLPDSMEVQPVRSGIPMRLENGVLCSVVDGVSIDKVGGVGFRQPSWFSRYYWYLWAGGCLLLVGFGSWVLHRRKTH